jgi:hypothetical protein
MIIHMYNSELFHSAKSALENCLGVRQAFNTLPPGVEISVSLDNRVPCTLTCSNQAVTLEPRQHVTADIEFTLFSESIRRLKDNAPEDIMGLTKELASLSLAGHAKGRILCSPKELYTKGYITALKGLGPELQKDLSKYAFILMGQASQLIETIKTLFKR